MSVWASSCFAPSLHHRLRLSLVLSVAPLQRFLAAFCVFIPQFDHFIFFKKRKRVTAEDGWTGQLPAPPSATWSLCHILRRLQHQETSFSSLCLQDSVHARREVIKALCINKRLLEENVEIKIVSGSILLLWPVDHQTERDQE